MASIAYDNGLDLLGGGTESGDTNWESLSWVVLGMLSSYTPDPTHQYISDIVGDELTAAGYSRWSVPGQARNVDTVNHRIDYQCDDPDLGAPVAGETFGGIVVAQDTGDDSTAGLVVFLEQDPPVATDGSELIYTLAQSAIARQKQA